MKPPSATSRVIYLDAETPLGAMRLATCERVPSRAEHASGAVSQDDFPALSGAWFLDQWDLPAPSDSWRENTDHPVLCQAQTQLEQWFAGQRREFDVPLAPQGTSFQQAVWNALLALPFGVTTSYSDLALSIGKPKAVRAAAQAVGRNPISIFIPCHRIIGRDTSLTGFGGGLERKQALLEHEGHRYLGHHPRVRRVDNGQLDLPW